MTAPLLRGTLRASRWLIRWLPGQVGFLLALAWLCVRLLGWARTVELWDHLPGCSPSLPAEQHAAYIDSLENTVRGGAARHLLPIECKERALCCWLLLREAGLPACMVVGIDLFPFLGHCWCEVGERIVSDDAARCTRFVPVLSYGERRRQECSSVSVC